MTELTEKGRTAAFILSEANFHRSRENVILSGGQNLEAGAVLGKITASGHYKAFDNAASDGSQTVAGILIEATDATEGEKGVAIIARDAEVLTSELVWAEGIDSGEEETALAALKTLGIIPR